uniref:Uncharacterized protein n=1 Tax=Amphimedon queenslandica TaxID=400682 RepID=A0A1X7UR70_AMPQE
MVGKHVHIGQPSNSGSYCFNYKNWFSIVLLAVVDANHLFKLVDIGCNYYRTSNGRVYLNTLTISSVVVTEDDVV